MKQDNIQSKRLSHEESIRTLGFDIAAPVSGSMRPMLRTRRDTVLFVPQTGRLKRYDVALYRSGTRTIVHRVICVKESGYIIRGDNSRDAEFVAEEQIIGVMKGFYRDEKYISADNWLYRCYSRLWVALHPVLIFYKRLKRSCMKRQKAGVANGRRN